MIWQIEQHGFAVIENALTRLEAEDWARTFGAASGAGRRGLLALPEVAAFARSESLLKLVRLYVGDEAFPVRAIYFDKSAEANWMVAWHQDLTVAVRSRVEVPGFGPWSVKEGVPHVQAPVKVLEKMLTMRIHLDDCDETNGALRVLPGSHRLGRLSSARIQELRAQQSEVVCRALAGDALLMRPLLLHASGKSRSERQRRVLHMEYAGFGLPGGLEWQVNC